MHLPRLTVLAATLLLIAGPGCFNTTQVGSYSDQLTVGLHEATTRSLRPGTWDWEVTYEHDGEGTTGEIQVFLDEGDDPRLLGKTSIGAKTGKTSGTVDIADRTDIRVMLEVSTTQGGDIVVEWDFDRR
ncbi:MAG: hypothetical protein KY455_12655 [Euryarchaeota archaeon]|nr:hypothetical protein [Euryarchaeota archaeon]